MAGTRENGESRKDSQKKPLKERQTEIRARIARGEPVTPKEKRLLNLKPRSFDSESGSEAAKKSQEAQRQRRTGKEIAQEYLAGKLTDEEAEAKGLPKGTTRYMAVMRAMYDQAENGNTKAAVFLRDTAGDMPTNKVQAEVGMTDADRALMERINSRLGSEKASK